MGTQLLVQSQSTQRRTESDDVVTFGADLLNTPAPTQRRPARSGNHPEPAAQGRRAVRSGREKHGAVHEPAAAMDAILDDLPTCAGKEGRVEPSPSLGLGHCGGPKGPQRLKQISDGHARGTLHLIDHCPCWVR